MPIWAMAGMGERLQKTPATEYLPRKSGSLWGSQQITLTVFTQTI